MPLTPEDIEGRKFPEEFKGYEREAVDSFMRAVARDYRSLLRALASAGQQIETPPPAPAPPPTVRATPIDVDVLKEPQGGASHRKAREEASAIVDAAEELAERILDSARRTRREMEIEAEQMLQETIIRAREFVNRALECNSMLVRVEQSLGPPREAFEASLLSFRKALGPGEGAEPAAARPQETGDDLAATLRRLRREMVNGSGGVADDIEVNGQEPGPGDRHRRFVYRSH